jgi:uncharacterized protein
MTDQAQPVEYMAFVGTHCIGSGSADEVLRGAKRALDADLHAALLLLDYHTSRVVDVDWRGTTEAVTARLTAAGAPTAEDAAGRPAEPRQPGRPKLGVVAREVTLLPRHWDWLNAQPGGASVTLRKLVEEARRATAGEVRVREAREASYRFMSIIAGDAPGYEEALRALYADDRERFETFTEQWPEDVRHHARRLAGAGFTR